MFIFPSCQRQGAGRFILAIFCLLGSSASVPGQRAIEEPLRILVFPLEQIPGSSSRAYIGAGMSGMLVDRLGQGAILPQTDNSDFLMNPENQSQNKIFTRSSKIDVSLFELNESNYLLPFASDKVKLARERKARFLIQGEFQLQDSAAGARGRLPEKGQVRYTIVALDAAENRHFKREYTSGGSNVYELADRIAQDLLLFIINRPVLRVRLETETPGAMLYIGGIYLGRTPVERDLLPGDYLIKASMEKYEDVYHKIQVRSSGANVFRLPLVKSQYAGRLAVTSNPPGARVYLDMEYLGNTPLERDDLPAGLHRLRISLKEHVDRFTGVELGGKLQQFHFDLESGDTARAFLDRDRALLDWSYHDLSFGSLMSTLGFYGSYWYFSVRERRILESARRQLPSLSLLRIGELNAYNYYLLEQNSREARVMRRYAEGSAYAAAFSLGAAVYFLAAGIKSDERETGELSGMSVLPFVYPEARGGFFGVSLLY